MEEGCAYTSAIVPMNSWGIAGGARGLESERILGGKSPS